MRPLSHVFLALALAAPLTTLAGCAALREAIGLGPQRPKVQLADISVTGASLTALDLALTLRVDNPNDYALKFSKLDYRVDAVGLTIASGTYAGKLSVPAEGHALLKLPLTVNAENTIRLAREMLTAQGDTFATLLATAEFESPFGAIDIGFEDKRPLKKLIGR